MSPFLLLSLLLLSLLFSDVQGIRLEKGFKSAGVVVGQHRIQKEEIGSVKRSSNGGGIVCKDGECSGTMNLKKRSVSRVSKKSHQHWLPSIHEDYYGPRSHRPKHH